MTRSTYCFFTAVTSLLALVPAKLAADPFLMVRSFDQRVMLTNSPMVVTVTLTNNGDDTLRGFYFTDQLPSAFAVTPVSVALSGQSLTNFSLETGCDGDLYPGYTPWRWRLETPVLLDEVNPLLPGADVRIVYTLSSSISGSFILQPYNWAACLSDLTNVVFGFSSNPCEGTIRFVDSTGIPLISAQGDTNGYSISLDGAPCTPYVLSVSTNLWDWLPLVTNTSPFTFVETNLDLFPQRFYRAEPLP